MVLPEPLRSHERDEVAGVDVQVQVAQHVDLLAAALIGLAEAAHLDEATPIDSGSSILTMMSP